MRAGQTRRSPAATGLRDRTHNTSRLNRITPADLTQRCAAKLRERIADHINEYRIRRASRAYLVAARCGDRSAQVAAWTRYGALHARRSPACVARLESKLGTRVRRTIKQGLMSAFLQGALPRGCVAAAFRLFGLRDA